MAFLPPPYEARRVPRLTAAVVRLAAPGLRARYSKGTLAVDRHGGRVHTDPAWLVPTGAIAVVANLPAQFGGVGTDAGKEFLTRGTAISAPLLPVVLMVSIVLLAPRRDRWSWVGVALAYITAVVVGIGGVGEMVAEPTADTSGTCSPSRAAPGWP
jgi:hypothetical protein